MVDTWKQRKEKGLRRAKSETSPARPLIAGTPLDPVLKAQVDEEKAKRVQVILE